MSIASMGRVWDSNWSSGFVLSASSSGKVISYRFMYNPASWSGSVSRSSIGDKLSWRRTSRAYKKIPPALRQIVAAVATRDGHGATAWDLDALGRERVVCVRVTRAMAVQRPVHLHSDDA